LRSEVLAAMVENVEVEHSARSGVLSLESAAIRQIYRYLRPTDGPLAAKPPK